MDATYDPAKEPVRALRELRDVIERALESRRAEIKAEQGRVGERLSALKSEFMQTDPSDMARVRDEFGKFMTRACRNAE